VAGEGPADAADLRQLGGGDDGRGRVADLPQLGEGELEQRQAAVRAGPDQLVDERLGLEADALDAGGADDRLAGALGRERAEDVDRPGDVVADAGDLGDAGQEVAAHGHEHPQAGQDPEARRASSGPTIATSAGAARVASSSNWSMIKQAAAALAELPAHGADQRVAERRRTSALVVSSGMREEDQPGRW
jgi:hypothetical protein